MLDTIERNETGLLEFLTALDPKAETFAFQTYDDRQNSEYQELVHAPNLHPNVAHEALCHLNSMGACVSVCINETDGLGHKVENIKRVRAIWVDDDDAGYLRSFPLEPSMTVQTSPGRYHYYWFVEDDWTVGEDGRCEEFDGVMRRMSKEHGCDPRCTNINRAMRVPEFFHMKDPSRPHLVQIIEDNEIRYTKAEILEYFPPIVLPQPHDDGDGSEPGIEWGDDERERTVGALANVSADTYDIWFTVGAALHDASGGSDDGFEIFNSWSQHSRKYDGEVRTRKFWDSFRDHPRPIKLGSVYRTARQNGWDEDVLRSNKLPFTELPEGPLTDCIADSVKKQFLEYEHEPSARHWKGIRQIAATFEGMADGSLESKFWMSSLPPGMGKTTTLVHAVRELLNMKVYNDKSVIIFLDRLEEIRDLAKKMELSRNEFGVLSSKDEYNKLGNPDHRQPRVLFTTKKMLETRCSRYKTFADTPDFHYTGSFDGVGRPREIRVWDEAIVPARNITLNGYLIGKLFDGFAAEYPELAQELASFVGRLGELEDRSLVEVPDVAEKHNLREDDARSLFETELEHELVSRLWFLSGRTVRVRKDRHGKTALDYDDLFPIDMAPLLILDASGQIKPTYRFWADGRKNLGFLRSPPKSYRNLPIHHWDTAGSKSAYEKGGGTEQIEGIAKTILNEIPPDEDVLIVHFKEDKRRGIPHFEEELDKAFTKLRDPNDDLSTPFRPGNISYLTYGRHTATNEFHNYKYVIVAGVYLYPASEIEAGARGAKDLRAEEELSLQDFLETKYGEMAHNLYQAANRGMMRKADGDGCREGCHLYVIGYRKHNIRQILPKIFPDAVVQDWRPIINPKDNIVRAVEFLLERAKAGHLRTRNNEIIKHVVPEDGDRNLANFNKLVLRHRDFQALLLEHGYRVEYPWGAVELVKVEGNA